ncbi:MAG: hypothetical protein EZS28_005176 [Streblomastix strix]|uniref:Uncharacterized protein n=1 Tax=Streblomastix strix TaxID=222440 RepID=A0A5J4WXL3_9EUKA|nr:MAG: hypothetical protein EZS28_005176 [Streblomastix strix]
MQVPPLANEGLSGVDMYNDEDSLNQQLTDTDELRRVAGIYASTIPDDFDMTHLVSQNQATQNILMEDGIDDGENNIENEQLIDGTDVLGEVSYTGIFDNGAEGGKNELVLKEEEEKYRESLLQKQYEIGQVQKEDIGSLILEEGEDIQGMINNEEEEKKQMEYIEKEQIKLEEA